jgi:hypothetical protein
MIFKIHGSVKTGGAVAVGCSVLLGGGAGVTAGGLITCLANVILPVLSLIITTNASSEAKFGGQNTSHFAARESEQGYNTISGGWKFRNSTLCLAAACSAMPRA